MARNTDEERASKGTVMNHFAPELAPFDASGSERCVHVKTRGEVRIKSMAVLALAICAVAYFTVRHAKVDFVASGHIVALEVAAAPEPSSSSGLKRHAALSAKTAALKNALVTLKPSAGKKASAQIAHKQAGQALTAHNHLYDKLQKFLVPGFYKKEPKADGDNRLRMIPDSKTMSKVNEKIASDCTWPHCFHRSALPPGVTPEMAKAVAEGRVKPGKAASSSAEPFSRAKVVDHWTHPNQQQVQGNLKPGAYASAVAKGPKVAPLKWAPSNARAGQHTAGVKAKNARAGQHTAGVKAKL